MKELPKPQNLPGKDPEVGSEQYVWNNLVLHFSNCVKNTLLAVETEECGENEIKALNDFIDRAAEINPTVFNEGTREHLRLTGKYSRILAESLRSTGVNINPDKAEALGLIHDIGRTFTHRKGRNEAIEAVLMRTAGLSKCFLKDLYSDTIFAPENLQKMTDKAVANEIVGSLKEITGNPYWATVLTADLLAKKNRDGRLRRWEDVVEQGHFSDKYEEPRVMWPSEKRRWMGARMEGHKEAVNKQYVGMGRWMEKHMGVKINDVVERMETCL